MIKTVSNLLPKRLSHNFGTNLALPRTMQKIQGLCPVTLPYRRVTG